MSLPPKGRRIRANPFQPIFWLCEIFTEAKSFRANPLLGSRSLNAIGLHTLRKVLAHGMTAARRLLLRPFVPRAWREAFQRDGYVAIENFLPAHLFDALSREADLLLRDHSVQLREGDTITELALVDDNALQRTPSLAHFYFDRRFLDMANYIGARLKLPRCYVQRIRRDLSANAPDPQRDAHSDTFFPTLKGWLFLDDVDLGRAPFHYSRGSHHLTRARLAWEHRRSLHAKAAEDAHTAAGSFRANCDDFKAMGLPPPHPLLVKANTLVLADTAGFHCRGEAADDRPRRSIYVWMRSNPYNPVLGFRSRLWRRMELAVTKAHRRSKGPPPTDALQTSAG